MNEDANLTNFLNGADQRTGRTGQYGSAGLPGKYCEEVSRPVSEQASARTEACGIYLSRSLRDDYRIFFHPVLRVTESQIHFVSLVFDLSSVTVSLNKEVRNLALDCVFL